MPQSVSCPRRTNETRAILSPMRLPVSPPGRDSAPRGSQPLALALLGEESFREIQSFLNLAESSLHVLNLIQSFSQVVKLGDSPLHLLEHLPQVSRGCPAPGESIGGQQPPDQHLRDADAQDDEPHADGPHGYLKHAPSPSLVSPPGPFKGNFGSAISRPAPAAPPPPAPPEGASAPAP